MSAYERYFVQLMMQLLYYMTIIIIIITIYAIIYILYIYYIFITIIIFYSRFSHRSIQLFSCFWNLPTMLQISSCRTYSHKKCVFITMIWTTIGLSLTYALLLKYWKNLSYPKILPTSTITIFTLLVNQHIVQITALKQLFWKLLMICNFLLTKATYLY